MHEEVIAARGRRAARPCSARSRSRAPGGGEADPRHRRGRRRLRRLPRGPRLHAEDAEGARHRCRAGAIGDVTWARSRETHPGPHSAWFWDAGRRAAGAIVDLGCHCIEIVRNFIGKGNRPVEVMCWADTLVHPIEAEDNAIALIRFEIGRDRPVRGVWTFRGGMDLRDEVAGTEGTIWLDHFLRTGFEMFTLRRGRRLRGREGRDRRAAGCSRSATRSASSATSTCSPTCSTRSTQGRAPMETLLRRLRRQRDHRRVLPLRGDRASGSRSSSSGAAARRRASPSATRNRTATRSSRRSTCPTAAAS